MNEYIYHRHNQVSCPIQQCFANYPVSASDELKMPLKYDKPMNETLYMYTETSSPCFYF